MFVRCWRVVACLIVGTWSGFAFAAMQEAAQESSVAECSVANDTDSARFAVVVELGKQRVGTLLSDDSDLVEHLSMPFAESESLDFEIRHFGGSAIVDVYRIDETQLSELDGKQTFAREFVGNLQVDTAQPGRIEIASARSKKQRSADVRIVDVGTFLRQVEKGKVVQAGCCVCRGVKCCPTQGKCMTCYDCGDCCKGT